MSIFISVLSYLSVFVDARTGVVDIKILIYIIILELKID